jgi:hypothetical protein
MRGDDRLRQSAELFRRAADRSECGEAREHLLQCAAELGEMAAWVEARHAEPDGGRAEHRRTRRRD